MQSIGSTVGHRLDAVQPHDSVPIRPRIPQPGPVQFSRDHTWRPDGPVLCRAGPIVEVRYWKSPRLLEVTLESFQHMPTARAIPAYSCASATAISQIGEPTANLLSDRAALSPVREAVM
jgi:hypothetical protein